MPSIDLSKLHTLYLPLGHIEHIKIIDFSSCYNDVRGLRQILGGSSFDLGLSDDEITLVVIPKGSTNFREAIRIKNSIKYVGVLTCTPENYYY